MIWTPGHPAGPCRPEVMNDLFVDMANAAYRRAVVAHAVKRCGGLKRFRRMRERMERREP